MGDVKSTISFFTKTENFKNATSVYSPRHGTKLTLLLVLWGVIGTTLLVWAGKPVAERICSLRCMGHFGIVDNNRFTFKTSVEKDKSITMFKAYVAAYLNKKAGNCTVCEIDMNDWINEGKLWLIAHPVGSGVTGDSQAWQDGEQIYLILDAYNNGLSCAAPRD